MEGGTSAQRMNRSEPIEMLFITLALQRSTCLSTETVASRTMHVISPAVAELLLVLSSEAGLITRSLGINLNDVFSDPPLAL